MFEGLTEEQLGHVCAMQVDDLNHLMEQMTTIIDRHKRHAAPGYSGMSPQQVHLSPTESLEVELLQKRAEIIKVQYVDAYALLQLAYYRRCAINVMEGEVVRDGAGGDVAPDGCGAGEAS